MFRVKTSQASTVYTIKFLERLVFLVDDSMRRSEAFLRAQKSERVEKVKSEKVLVVLLLALTVLSGCRRAANTNSNTGFQSVMTTRVVTDDLGRQVTIPVKVTRVVSTAPSVTENIFAVGASDRLVGVTTFCNYPAEAKAIAKIGDTVTPNMESIIALKPEVVFVSTASQIEAFMKTLEQNGTAVYVTNPTSLDSVLKNLTQLGDLFGTQDTAAKLVADLQRRVEAVMAMEKYELDLQVFVQVSREPLFTIGRESFVTTLLKTAGAVSATADVATAYPKLSPEAAAALNPDVIILSDSEDNRDPNAAFRKSKAVASGRVYRIDADLLSRPGPRLVDGLEQIARSLHTHRS